MTGPVIVDFKLIGLKGLILIFDSTSGCHRHLYSLFFFFIYTEFFECQQLSRNTRLLVC